MNTPIPGSTPRLAALGRAHSFLLVLCCSAVPGPHAVAFQVTRHEWLSWRGPDQCGVSSETGLIDHVVVDGENHLWTLPLAGRGTPVIGNGRIYAFGYRGEGKDLREYLVCLDENSGEVLWERGYNDLFTDIVYDRYSIGAPTIDRDTGNVHLLNCAATLVCLSPGGNELWRHNLMNELGRISFPNGRIGSPVIDGDLSIVHMITAHWGPQGPAANRFYAFDKRTGRHVWTSSPGIEPVDSPYSTPVLSWHEGKRVLYAGTGCGNLVCINVMTGEPLWRFRTCNGGICTSPVLYRNLLIASHGSENMDTSEIGRLLAIDVDAPPKPQEKATALLEPGAERWRTPHSAFSSSPILVGDRVYQTTQTGELLCVGAGDGKVYWEHKLASDQIHASPAYGDGKLYVPMNNGSFFIVRPNDQGPEILCQVQLAGNCLGAPAICNGRIYVHTTGGLYCFGRHEEVRPVAADKTGPPARLQIVPGDFMVHPGESIPMEVRVLDANGFRVGALDSGVKWTSNPPLSCKVDDDNRLSVPDGGKPGSGVLTAAGNGVEGSARVRVLPLLPYLEDFEGFDLSTPHPTEAGVKIAQPPSFWLGGFKKWEVRDRGGNKVLAKLLDNPFFMRSYVYLNSPELSGYTMQIDILSDGNRRTMSSAGVIHQNYLIELKGNHQEIEVSSNMERIKETAPFSWTAGAWYTLKSRVDVAADMSGVVRVKVWKKGEAEPPAWNLEVEHRHAHASGAPGLFGFTPQSRFRVYIDNLVVTPNQVASQ